jgi:L-arabinose isomerase
MEVMEDFAEIAGLELVRIDGRTDGRDFRRELRWSQVYWHLAGAV